MSINSSFFDYNLLTLEGHGLLGKKSLHKVEVFPRGRSGQETRLDYLQPTSILTTVYVKHFLSAMVTVLLILLIDSLHWSHFKLEMQFFSLNKELIKRVPLCKQHECLRFIPNY